VSQQPGVSFKQELVGLFGQPVAENPTQAMVEAAFRHHGLDWRYLTIEVDPAALAAAVAGARAMGFRGFNVTIPHKLAVVARLDALGASAELIGAVNCVVRRGETLVGENTDGRGFVEALRTVRDPAGARVVVLGAGGAARAVLAALADIGCDEVRLVNRTAAKAKALADLADVLSMHAAAYAWEDVSRALTGAHLLVNATSLGMSGAPPLPALELSCLAEDAAVYDLVYAPRETPLLTAARLQGLNAIEGLDMLIGQARPSFEAFFGCAPPETVDARALLADARPAEAPEPWPVSPA